MSTTATRFIDTVPWDQLQHAYGSAADLPPVLESVRSSSGRKLEQALTELCSRVLHQGTIYSASPPALHVLIEMLPDAEPKKRGFLYGLLDAFADSARMAIEDGPAPPSCAGGDPADGEAIRKELADAHRLFEADSTHPEAEIRGFVAGLLTFVASIDPSTGDFVRNAYAVEMDPQVRNRMLAGLARLPNAFENWPDFWNGALGRETDPDNRFIISALEVGSRKETSDPAAVEDLVANFVKTSDADYHFGSAENRFFEAIALLGPERNLAALLEAFQLAQKSDLARVLAERLLRHVFNDQRTGWGQTSLSRLREDGSPPPQTSMYRMALRSIGMLMLFKLFPFARRWHVRKLMRRKPTGIRKIEYWGLKGTAPEIPPKLDEAQRAVLIAFAEKSELWQFRTNLWGLFGLPDNAAEMRRFTEER